MGKRKSSKKHDDDEDEVETRNRETILWLVAFGLVAIVTLALSITALVRSGNSSSSSSNEVVQMFTSKFDPLQVTTNSPNITVRMSKFENTVNLYIPFWMGTCQSAGSPPYAPVLDALSGIPTKYRMYNTTSKTTIDSAYFPVPANTNSIYSVGMMYVDSDGKLHFYFNWNDSSKSWNQTCQIYQMSVTYPRDV